MPGVVTAITPASESYLKAIYRLATSGEAVTTGVLAHELGVSSPSASAMAKRLEGEHLLERPEGAGLRLTPEGERIAVRVVRRHRLLETFLVRVLDMSWDEVHAEAELLEHVLNDRLEERIDAVLGADGPGPDRTQSAGRWRVAGAALLFVAGLVGRDRRGVARTRRRVLHSDLTGPDGPGGAIGGGLVRQLVGVPGCLVGKLEGLASGCRWCWRRGPAPAPSWPPPTPSPAPSSTCWGGV